MVLNLGYQSQKFYDSTQNFFSSDSLVAKIVFLILIIIIFVILLRMGTMLMTMFFTPSGSPILINGMKDAKKMMTIPQDPKQSESIPILRSDNQYNGIEFTWSVWINIDDPAYNQYTYKHIFHKGNSKISSDGIADPLNAPGLYISPVNYPNMSELSLLLRMNVFTNENNSNNLAQLNQACLNAVDAQQYAPNTNPATPQETIELCKSIYPNLNNTSSGDNKSGPMAPDIYDDIEIPDIPINKWVNVIIRCSYNNIIDIYINGRLLRRHTLNGVARQNYGDVYVNMNGGFSGFTSCLRYFNYALGTAKINSIVSDGPCLNTIGDLSSSKNPYYLANQWYSSQTDDLFAN